MAWILFSAFPSEQLILGLQLGMQRVGCKKEMKEAHWPEHGLGVMAYFNCQHDSI